MINIDGSEFNKTGAVNGSDKTTSINVASNRKSSSAQKTSFEGVFISKASVDRKAMDQNTYNSLMKEAEEVKSQIMQSATDAKANLKTLFNRLSVADVVKINEEGFNLNDLSQDECVNIVDRIKIELAAYNENYRAFAGDIDVSKIKEVLGSEGFAQKVAGQLSEYNVPDTEDNIEAVKQAADKIPENREVSVQAKLYMTANKCDVTLDNIQIAEHAYRPRNNVANEKEWNDLKPQIENIIKKAGLPVNDANLYNAKALLAEDMPVTEENLQYMAQIDAIDFSPENISQKTIDAISKGIEPEKAVITEGTDIYREVAKALDTLDKVTEEHLELAEQESEDGFVTLNSLEHIYLKYVVDGENNTSKYDYYERDRYRHYERRDEIYEKKDTKRMLLEIQILMTAEAGIHLEKTGLSINTLAIPTLHRHLLAYDKEMFMDRIGNQLAHDIDGEELYNTAFDVNEALYNIRKSPVEAVGEIYREVLMGEIGTVTVMSAASTGMSVRERLSRAGAAYQMMGSRVRPDLGDSVERAVEASAGTMLADMGMEDTQKNREAVTILVKNSMDVTKENIINIKELKSTLDSLIDNMKPETVLDMIRNNINPYTTDIHEVNEYLKTENEKNGRKESEDKYSTFLYKLDKTEGITAEERKQYIGIYKMINMFTKDAGEAIGALAAQGMDITMSNLLKAYNNKKAYSGIDIKVDGNIDVSAYEKYYTNLFKETGDKITPNTLKNVDDEQPIYERSVENFCEAADRLYDAEAEASYMDEYMKLVRQVAAADAAVINELEYSGEEITINNIQAMEQLVMSDMFNNRFGIDKNKAKQIFDSMDDRAKLMEAIEELCDDKAGKLEEELDKEDNSYDVVKANSINQMTAQMMVRAAKRQDYTIPYIKQHGIGMMKVSFKSDDEQAGKISISYDDAVLGKVSVNVSVKREAVEIIALYETKAPLRGPVDKKEEDGAEAFKHKLNNVSQNIKTTYGYKKAGVVINPVRNVARTVYDNKESDVSTAILYKIAKTVVEGLV